MPRPPKAQPQPDSEDRTDPGGPSPETLEKARREAAASSGDATLIYDKNKGRARTAPADQTRLVVSAGPKKGAEFVLVEERTTVGRGSDNVVVIPDISVSRLHAIVQREGERWVLLDQGSGNGTRVNGKQVERYPLQTGDEIAMGDTVVQFLEPGGIVVKAKPASKPSLVAGPPAKLAPSPNRRTPLYVAIAAILAVIFGLGYVRKLKRDAARAEAERQQQESGALAQQRFQEGVALLKQGKWIEARDKLKIAAELDSQDAEIARYLESAEAEAPRAQAIASARAALAKQDYAGARAALANVPDDSAQVDQARELAAQIKGAMDAAVREARQRVESGDAAGAAEALDPVLAAEPARPDALAVKDAIGASRKTVRAEAPRRERAPAPAKKAPEAPPDVQGILDAYLAGDIGAALQQAEHASANPRAARLLSELRRFDAAYKDGLAKQSAHKPAEALRAFDQAALADKSIANGREGRLGHEVRKATSALHLDVARSLGDDEATLPQRSAHLRAAVQADPSNDAAQSMLRSVSDKAKEIYMRAYMAKDSDKATARAEFKLVVDSLPPGDDTAQKAKRWLDKLDGKVADGE